MVQYFRFILYVITGFFLFIFVYVTFYSDQYRGHKNQVDYSGLGLYAVSGDITDSSSLEKTKLTSQGDFLENEREDSIFLDNSKLLGSYYVSEKGIESYSREETGTGQTITLGDGEYYFDFQKPKQEIFIESDDFSLEVISKGRIYIKQTDRFLGFYSFDAIFKVHVKDIYTGVEASSFYVYPGMYAKGNKYSKKAGLKEDVSSFNELFYINNLQLTGKKQSNNSDSNILMYSFNFIYLPYEIYFNDLVSRDFKKVVGVTTDFLDLVLLHEKEEKALFKASYSHLEGLYEYRIQISSHLEKYLSVFFNDSKKVVYYKNEILYNLSEIVKNNSKTQKTSKVIGTEQLQYVDEIWKNLEILQGISDDEYHNTLDFIRDTYYFFTYIYPSDFPSKQHLQDLYLGERVKDDFVRENNDYISHLFQLYHSDYIDADELNIGIMRYVISSSRILDPENPQSFYYYYYVYDKVLENYIDTLGVSKEGFNDIVRILEDIAFIEKGYFSSEEAKKGVLYINAEIIENILLYLRNLYFEELRDSEGLLILRDNSLNISDSTILNLEKNIEYLLDYQKRANILDKTKENDSALLQKYERFLGESEEYFEAVINNDGYLNAKMLGALERYASFAKEEEDKLSVEGVKEYLEAFNQVSLKSAKIDLIDESYFEIRGVKIAGENMSFDIYPLEFNKINNLKKATESKEYLADILLTNSEEEFQANDINNITTSELYEYLVDLGYVEVLEKDISIVKNTYYSLKNINVSGTKYDFSFFPQSGNTVIGVMEGLGVAYKLDNLKPTVDVRDEVKANEEYKNFFVDLVTKTKIAEKELVIVSDESAKESVEENIFKNDFLFGKQGDFTKISNDIDLKYENVDVAYMDGEYNTFVKNVVMLPKERGMKNAKGENIQAYVTAEYVIAESRSYFKRMTLKFLLFKGDKTENGKYDFGNEKMQIVGTIDIDTFSEFYENVWSDYEKISRLNETRMKVLGETEISNFRYIPSTREAGVNFEYNNDVITVSFREGEVVKISYGNQIFEGADLDDIENVFRLFL